jgi:hypothetical protein
MAAGLSKEQIYRIIYNRLLRTQYELSVAGVESTYKRRTLYHCPIRSGNAQFTISYSVSNLSNGETFGYPVISLTDEAGNWEYYSDFSWTRKPYKEGIARIIELFAGKVTWDSTRATK